ncbi:MAG: hypothetical protein O7E52_20210 [Candidatus Poribacteria bacterium]|nr:hypothetical protein [Candidatus Poribacteria bacterium]
MRIKIVNQGSIMQLFLNDEMIFDGKDISGNKGGRIGLGTEDTSAEFDDVFLSGLRGRSVEAADKLTITWGKLKALR